MPKIALFLLVWTLHGVAWSSEPASLGPCAVDLCGPASRNMTLSAGGVFEEVVPLNVKAFLRSELEPALRESFELSRDLQSRKFGLAKKILAHPSRIVLNENQRVFLTMASAFSLIIQAGDQALESKNGTTYTVNEEVLERRYPRMDRSRLRTFSELFNRYANSTELAYANFASGVDYDYFFRIYVGGGETAKLEQIQPVMYALGMESGQLIGKLGTFVFSDLDTTLFWRDLEKEPLSDVEKKETLELIARLLFYQALISEKIATLALQANLNVDEAMEYIDLRKIVLSEEKRQSDPVIQKAALESFIGQCSRAATRFFAAAPSPLRLRANEKLVETVKTASLQSARRFFSGANLAAAESAIRSLKTKAPLSSSEVEGRLRDLVQNQLKSQRLSVRRLSGDANAEADAFLYLVKEFIAVSETKELSRDLSDFCDRLSPAGFTDKAYNREGRIQVSWQSMMFPDIGAGVIAHEIGHLISYRMSYGSEGSVAYQAVRECSVKRHEFLLGEKTDQYAEEDWADQFAIDVIARLSRMGAPGGNFGCALLSFGADKDGYRTPILFDARRVDSHSTSLLRALLVEKSIKGTIPRSCQEALGEKNRILEQGFCRK